MTAYLFLLGAICTSAMNNIVSAAYTAKNKGRKDISSTYSVFVTGSASLFWGIYYLLEFSFDPKVLLYALGYGIFYTLAFVGLYKALELGSVSLTAFAKQLSLIAVAVWGFIFWNSSLDSNIILGMVLIVAALYLCFKPDKGSGVKTVSLKWLFFAALLLVGNAGCSILQKMQQGEFSGQHRSMLMFFGCLLSFVVCMAAHLRGKRCPLSEIDRFSIVFPILGGLSSAFLNLFIILLINSALSESVFFPGIAVGGLILTTVYSVAICREKLKPRQWLGLAVGTVALVFLNL